MRATSLLRRFLARVVGQAIVLFARAITAVHAEWRGVGPSPRQRVYFANHVSNADMPMIWSVLPHHLRLRTRPVAASDYWLKTSLRAFAGRDVFRAVLIDRRPEARVGDPMEAILAALDEGASLILFPEGLRNQGPEPLKPFRSGLYNIAAARPDVELVPTWIANLNAVMPKGEIIPLPLMVRVIFGDPVALRPGEERHAFLDRAASALLALRPQGPGTPGAERTPDPAPDPAP
ncbi:MAG: lysophospholipid acyltransferase family protein [Pararhodobacter sp.]